jgi:hypothetical protein
MRYLNIAAFAAVVYVNYLANARPINGLTTGEISAMYPSLFTPAGITFSIWGVIYLLLLAFVVYGAIRRFTNDDWIHPLFLITCICNASWIFAWHYLQTGLSVLIMLIFLITLINIYLRLPGGRGKEFWFVRVPFSVYLAWICVATVANVSALLIDLNFTTSFEALFTIVMIAALLAVLYFVQRINRNWPFTLTVIWALGGIMLARNIDNYISIVIAAGTAILVSVWITSRAPRTA